MKLYILFRLNDTKKNSHGLCPLIVRITYQGERRQRATSYFLSPKQWKGIEEGRKQKDPFLISVQEHIRSFNLRAYSIADKLQRDERMHIDILLEVLDNIEKPSITLLQLINEHNKALKERTGHDRSVETLEKYDQLLRKVSEFIPYQYNKKDLHIKDLSLSFLEHFRVYLVVTCKLSHNTIVKYYKNLIAVTNYGWRMDLINFKPFEKAPTIPYQDIDRSYLNQSELKRLEEKSLPIERLQIVRDLFIFQCYTGLSYIDMMQLKRQHLIEGVDGKPWIVTFRQKTKVKSMIPLLGTAQTILGKYEIRNQDETLLPVLSNQKMNAYLKEIAMLCGINKELTTHVARRTFATTITLQNGVSIESISKMLGHSSSKITKLYAVVTDMKISDEMEALAQKLKST